MFDPKTIPEKLARLINRPGLYGYESGMTVTEIRPGYGEGILNVTPMVMNPTAPSTAAPCILWPTR